VICQHLEEAGDPAPRTPYTDGCPQCVADGFDDWVHLRLCLSCGLVACCDSSPRRHMSKHFDDEHHPIMRSYEPGEAWRWCFVDEVLG
jgi:uncharacterized UBP type Zn finger protein